MVKLLEPCHLSLEMVIKAAAGHKPESRKLLMVELRRCLGYFNRENRPYHGFRRHFDG